MKKLLLNGLAIASSFMSFAQSIPNASFESWSQEPLFREIDAAGEMLFTSAEISFFESDTINVLPTNSETTAYLSNIEYDNGSETDTLEAFLLWGVPPNDETGGGGFPIFEGGFPYTTMATSINVRMRYQCNVLSPCLVVAQFKKEGVPVGSYTFPFYSERNDFFDTTFTFSTPLAASPDTAVIGITVNNLLDDDSPRFPGDFIELDYIRINDGMTSIPGGTFNDWKDYSLPEQPDAWFALNGPRDTVSYRSSMASEGDYSILLTTKIGSDGDTISGLLLMGEYDLRNELLTPNLSFTTSGDYELSFDYKYSSGPAVDSATVGLLIVRNGFTEIVAYDSLVITEQADFVTHTFESFSALPGDTVIIIAAPSIDYDDESTGTIAPGNKLWLDNFRFEIVTGLNSENPSESFTVYPNPSSGVFRYNFNGIEGIEKVEVVDNSGRVLYEQKQFTGFDDIIDLSSEKNGVYQLVITSSNGVTTRKMMKR